eukprot:2845775-Amphidinium_carterae.1
MDLHAFCLNTLQRVGRGQVHRNKYASQRHLQWRQSETALDVSLAAGRLPPPRITVRDLGLDAHGPLGAVPCSANVWSASNMP